MDHIYEMVRILRAGRHIAEFTQDELAKRAGVSRKMIVNMELQREGTTADDIEAVRVALEEAGIVFLPSTEDRSACVGFLRNPPK